MAHLDRLDCLFTLAGPDIGMAQIIYLHNNLVHLIPFGLASLLNENTKGKISDEIH